MRIRVLAVFLVVSYLSPLKGRADDTALTLGAGGLVPLKSTHIAMKSEDLQISVHRIMVRYVFQNTSAEDADVLVGFPLPDLSGPAEFGSPINIPNKSRLNFIDFKVPCDGKIIPTRMEARAFLGGRDVTSLVRAAGLSVSPLYDPLQAAVRKLAPNERHLLESEGLLYQVSPGGWLAWWTERVMFYWRQHFPAKSDVELVQSYRPVVGGSYIVDDGSYIVKSYCGGADSLRRIKAREYPRTAATSGNIVWWERNIKFVLKTGNNWAGPIGRFRLTVLSDSPEDIVLTCMPGLKRVEPTRYVLTRSDFHPSGDLSLDVLQLNKQVTAK